MPHIEVIPNSKSITAPGWAYVPDTSANQSHASLPSSRKRAARNQPAASTHETSAKQDAKILRHIAELDKDNHRDVSIPVPVKARDGAGRVSHGKVTPNVRKILQSQKTFANHLSDAEAFAAQQVAQPTASSSIATPSARRGSPATPAALTSAGKRSHKRKSAACEGSTSTPLRKVSSITQDDISTQGAVKRESTAGLDVSMGGTPAAEDTSILASVVPPPAHASDNDPLLRSRLPLVPSNDELEALLDAPPLSYLAAKAQYDGDRKPVRKFCEICGYWGRVRCLNCGGRVCGMECKAVHEESNCVRFYS